MKLVEEFVVVDIVDVEGVVEDVDEVLGMVMVFLELQEGYEVGMV